MCFLLRLPVACFCVCFQSAVWQLTLTAFVSYLGCWLGQICCLALLWRSQPDIPGLGLRVWPRIFASKVCARHVTFTMLRMKWPLAHLLSGCLSSRPLRCHWTKQRNWGCDCSVSFRSVIFAFWGDGACDAGSHMLSNCKLCLFVREQKRIHPCRWLNPASQLKSCWAPHRAWV